MISDFEKSLVVNGIIDKNDIRHSIFVPNQSEYFVGFWSGFEEFMAKFNFSGVVNFTSESSDEQCHKVLSDKFYEDILKNKDNFEKAVFFIKNNPHRELSFKFVGDSNEIEERVMQPKYFVEHYIVNEDSFGAEPDILERIDNITNILNLENYLTELNRQRVARVIKGHTCRLSGEQALYLFECSSKEYEDFFNADKQDEKIFGLNKMEYLTLVKSFIEREQIKDFNLGPKREFVMRDIMEMKKIDFQTYAMELFNEDDEEILFKVHVDPDFQKQVVASIPENYTNIEKAIYVYAKLCRILSYDPEFYLEGQVGKPAEKHRQIENISLIGKETKDIICYDFTALYASILHDMGIDITIISDNDTKEFGEGHSSLKFIADKFYVKADAVTSIFSGDLIGSKINSFPNGIECLNISNETYMQFNKILDDVYTQVLTEEIKNHHFDKKEYSFESMIDGYHKVFDDVLQEKNFEDKLNIMMANVRNRNLSDMDSLFYMHQLRRAIFSEKERQNNISLIILKENCEDNPKPSAVLTLSKNNEREKEDKDYYLYDVDTKSFKWAPKDIIYEKLQNKQLEYVGGEKPFIPNLSKVEYYDGYETVIDFE